MNPVQELIARLQRGELTLEETADKLSRELEPAVRRRPSESAPELLRREDDDPQPYTPGSWDDVENAPLSSEQYQYLREHVRVPETRWVDDDQTWD